MYQISVKSMIERDVSAWARIAGDQMPFATALALTRTAQAAKAEIERQMPALIDRPTPWTRRGLRLESATKLKLSAKVEFRPGSRDWLAPIVYGQRRKLKAFERSIQGTGLVPSGMYAVPGSAAKLDAYGNMSAAQIRRMVSSIKSWKGPARQGRRKAVAATGKGQTYFIGQPGGGKLPLGIWEKTTFSGGSAIKPVVIFVGQPSYRQQFDVPGMARQMILQRFPAELRTAVGHALRTRR